MPSHRRLLLVEDDASIAGLYLTYLKGEAFDVEHVETGGAALAIAVLFVGFTAGEIVREMETRSMRQELLERNSRTTRPA